MYLYIYADIYIFIFMDVNITNSSTKSALAAISVRGYANINTYSVCIYIRVFMYIFINETVINIINLARENRIFHGHQRIQISRYPRNQWNNNNLVKCRIDCYNLLR